MMEPAEPFLGASAPVASSAEQHKLVLYPYPGLMLCRDAGQWGIDAK